MTLRHLVSAVGAFRVHAAALAPGIVPPPIQSASQIRRCQVLNLGNGDTSLMIFIGTTFSPKGWMRENECVRNSGCGPPRLARWSETSDEPWASATDQWNRSRHLERAPFTPAAQSSTQALERPGQGRRARHS
jgi:hypothetical protein